jgi:hypothetical protein
MVSVTVSLRRLGGTTDMEWTADFIGTDDPQEDIGEVAQILTNCQLALNRLAGRPKALAVMEARLLLKLYKNSPQLSMLYAKLLEDIDA